MAQVLALNVRRIRAELSRRGWTLEQVSKRWGRIPPRKRSRQAVWASLNRASAESATNWARILGVHPRDLITFRMVPASQLSRRGKKATGRPPKKKGKGDGSR